MLEWMKKRRSTVADVEPEPETNGPHVQRSVMFGKSAGLFKYLDTRYADTVVLTFAEIEDLLGVSLPEGARLSAVWWTHPDANTPRPRFSDSWILANRTARPNLLASTVVFDRES